MSTETRFYQEGTLLDVMYLDFHPAIGTTIQIKDKKMYISDVVIIPPSPSHPNTEVRCDVINY